MAGVAPLTWSDVWSWARLTGRRLMPGDVQAIRAIDKLFVEIRSEDARKQLANSQPQARK